MNLIEQYFELREAVFAHFGYEENWCAIPMEDSRQYHWYLLEDEYGSGEVRFHENAQSIIDDDGNYYCDEIYTQRFLSKWVYRAEDFTMICTNPGVDGNKFLRIFDNSKEVKDVQS